VYDNDSILDSIGNPLGGAGVINGNYTSGEVYTVEELNDYIEEAFNIIGTTSYQNSINTQNATSSLSDPTLPAECGISGSGQATVWYKYYLPMDDAIAVDTLASDYDTFIAIWEGTDINDLRFVACNDDAGGTKQSAVSIRVTGGKTYYIEVGQP
jgi:hypothetical protein